MSSIIPSPPGPATTAKRGTMSAADFAKLAAITGTNTGNVTLGAVGSAPAAEGASVVGQVITLQPASATLPGVVTATAQELGGAKTLTGAILAGVTTITEAVVALVRAVGVSLVLRSSLGAGASDKCVVVGSSAADADVNGVAKLLSVRTGLGGVEVEKTFFYKDGTMVVDVGATPIGFGKFVYGRNGGFVFDPANGVIGCGNAAQIRLWTSLATGASGALATFEAMEFLAMAGLPATLRSSQGALATDVAVKVGTTVADVSVNAAAKLFVVAAGINGTQVDALWATKTHFGGSIFRGKSASLGFVSSDDAAGTRVGYGSCEVRVSSASVAILAGRFDVGVGFFQVSHTTGLMERAGTDSSATPGAAAINKPTGKSAIAAGAANAVITNSLVTAASRINITPMENATANAEFRSYKVTPAAGSFTVTLSSAVTLTWPFAWEVNAII